MKAAVAIQSLFLCVLQQTQMNGLSCPKLRDNAGFQP